MGNWSFLHPWLLAGLVGASLPVLIHLIGRRRAPKVRFAAIDFLLSVNKRLARRERLRQFLLLLLRTLAIIALVLAVARPTPKKSVAMTASAKRLAIVLDTSASMSYQLDGKTLLHNAKEEARRLLTHLQPGDSATLVVAGPEVRSVFQAPTLELSRVRDAIDAVDEAAGYADLGGAVEAALSQLGEHGEGAILAVIGDMAKNSFETLRPTGMDPAPELRLVDAARRERSVALPNAAVERVSIERGEQGPSERQFKILVRNFGTAPITDRLLELVIDGTVTHRAYVSVEGRSSAEKVLTYNFANPGTYAGEARLAATPEDGYQADDKMPFVVQVLPGVRVLAVDGDPRTNPYEDELFFLERALESVPKGEPPVQLRIATVDELAERLQELEDFDVVVLSNVAALPESQVATLSQFVENGGGLLFTLGDKVRFEQANDRFGALLPHPLRDVHKAADLDAGTPPLSIDNIDWTHPILAGLGLALEESLRASRTARYFNLDVGAGRTARTLLGYSNGAPALVESLREGQGRVLLLSTSVDLDMSDLALRSAFPALMQRSMRYLGGAVQRSSQEHLRAGQRVELFAPTGATAMALTSPSGERFEARLSPESGRRWTSGPLSEVGIYTAEAKRSRWEEDSALDVAVGPTLEESDFEPVALDRIAQSLGEDTTASGWTAWAGSTDSRDPFAARGFAPWLLLGLALFFLGESALAFKG